MLNRQFVATWRSGGGRTFILGVLALAAAAGGASAQGTTAIVVRGGVIASSALVTDDVAAEGAVEPVTARIGPAPVLAAVVRQELSPRLAFEAMVGYTFGSWQADDAGGWRDVESVGVPEASIALLRSYGDLSVHGAVGALSYRAPARGIFHGEPGMRPYLELGGGWRTPLAARRVEIQARVQAHKFGTSGIRSAGGLDGTVMRAGVSAAYRFGGAQ